MTVSRPPRPRRRPRTDSRTKQDGAPECLPAVFQQWFDSRGWSLRSHQHELLRAARARRDMLLIAPTGAGKTLAGFLPALTELAALAGRGQATERGAALHTLYISPLKALAVDVARNLTTPAQEMALPIRIETRTGDTPQNRRQRQRIAPPDIMLTTPEQLALLISHEDAGLMFANLRHVVLDELHALVTSKRGDLLALGLARLRRLAPQAIMTGLSATVAHPDDLRAWMMPQPPAPAPARLAGLVTVAAGAKPDVTILETGERLPWSGHSARHAMGDVYALIRDHRLSLVFVNTRSQAELVFQELWAANDDNLPIALHHGSLDREQRRKIEAAMAAGRLRAVVCTSTLDLGIDWGDIDLVIHVGAPKGASRLVQRIGRANHRLDEPSRAVLVPANRFEVMECRAAIDAVGAGDHDTPVARTGSLDVLAQHVWGMACSGPFAVDELYGEICSATPYRDLSRGQFDRVVDFVSTGGYALRTYDRFARLRPLPNGQLRLAHPRLAQQYRLNVGTIIESPMLKVRLTRSRRMAQRGTNDARLYGTGSGALKPGASSPGTVSPSALRGGRILGEVEEWFVEQLTPGDTFAFAGEILRFEGIRDLEVYASRSDRTDPMVPSYAGGKFPLSTHLASRVRRMLANQRSWRFLPDQVADWLRLQRIHSIVPRADEVLVETFPRGQKYYLVLYPFEGRLAHQTLGMLLTRRLDRAGARPLGFVANDYAMSLWCATDLGEMLASGALSLDRLFDEDMLGDDLDAWLADSSLMKRTFRNCAVISGLIERRHPGKEKSGRQVTFSSDLIYNVLREHEPGHILLEAAWADAAAGLLDIARLGDFLKRIRGRIRHIALQRISPLAVPVMLEIGREASPGRTGEAMLRESALELLGEASEG